MIRLRVVKADDLKKDQWLMGVCRAQCDGDPIARTMRPVVLEELVDGKFRPVSVVEGPEDYT